MKPKSAKRMRVNRQNTLVEDHLYPFAGETDAQVKKHIQQLLEPHAEFISQLQGAVLLHNIPFLVVLIMLDISLWYLFHLVSHSQFPTGLFVFCFYLFANTLFSFNGTSVFKALYTTLPALPDYCPDRIRKLEEVASLLKTPIVLAHQSAFFIYRSVMCPNPVDTVAIIACIGLIGFISTTLDLFSILFGAGIFLLLLPGVITREGIYNYMLNNLGNPIPENSK